MARVTWLFFRVLLFASALAGPVLLSAAPTFTGHPSGASITVGTASWTLTPSAGTAPYTFSWTPTATPIPGFRVTNRPEITCDASASATGMLLGIAVTPGTYSSSIRVTDGTGAFTDRPISFTVNTLNFFGVIPGGANTTTSTSWRGVNDSVSFRFFPAGGTPPYTFSIASGALPNGLSLIDAATGRISGALTQAGTFNFWVRLQDVGGGSISHGYSMTVLPYRLSNVPTRSLPNATVNQAYSFQLQMEGGAGGWTFAMLPGFTLPSGLTLSPSGLISGTPPTSVFLNQLMIAATDSASSRLDIALVISVLPVTPVPLGPPAASISAWVGYRGGFAFGATGGVPPYHYDLQAGQGTPAGLDIVDVTEYWPDRLPGQGRVLTGIQTVGTFTVTMRVTDSAGNVATRPIAVTTSELAWLQSQTNFPPCSGLPAPTLGTPYSQYLMPLGGAPPYTVTPVNIPAGLNIDNSGYLSGTPAEAGVNLNVGTVLSDSQGKKSEWGPSMSIAGSTPYLITINGGDVTINTNSVYSRTITCNGSPLATPNYSVTQVSGQLPPGLVLLTGNQFSNSGLNTNCAQVAGIPSTPGQWEVVLRATDASGNVGQRRYRWNISNVTIVNSGLAAGTQGVFYSQTIDARGGAPPYRFSTSSLLPNNLSIDPNTGTISGVPASAFSVSVGITVTDSVGSSYTRNLTLNVYPIAITTPNLLPTGFNGQPYAVTFSADPPSAYTWSTSSTLPSGLSLNSSAGVLSGTLNTTGTFTIVLTAGTSGAAVTKTFTLLATGLVQQAVITGLPTTYLGDFLVGSVVNTTLNLSGGLPPYTVSVVGGALPQGLALVPGQTYTGTTNFGRWAIAGIPTVPGPASVTLRYTDSAGLSVDRLISMNITPIALATTTLQPARVNTWYSFQLTGAGGSGYTYVPANLADNVLPPGLTLSQAGLLSGTPTATGSFSFTVQMTSGVVTRQVALTLTVNATADSRFVTLSFGPVSSDASLGRSFTATLTPSGGAGTHTWTALGTWPPGIQLLTGADLPSGFSQPTAVIGGAATVVGTYTFGVRADDSTGNFAVRYTTMTVCAVRPGPNNFPTTVSTVPLPGKVGTPYSFAYTASGGRAPYTFGAAVGTYLPPGMTFSSSGVLSGTPGAAGNFTVRMLITDADGKTRIFSSGITVYPQTQPIGMNGASMFPGITTGTLYNLRLDDFVWPGYGQAPFSWAVTNGNLPAGLTIVPGSPGVSAALQGTPTGTASATYTLTVTDANGKQALFTASQTPSPIGLSPVSGTLPPGVAGQVYAPVQFTAYGGTGSYTYQPAYNSDMPVGMSLSSSGLLSGTPSVYGDFLLRVLVKDSSGQVFNTFYYLNIYAPGTAVTALTVYPASINVMYAQGSPPPPTLMLNVGSSTGSPLAFTAAVSGGNWITLNGGSSSTPGYAFVGIMPFALAAGVYNGAVTITSSAASNSPVTVPVQLTVNAPVPCSFTLGASGVTMQAAGGPASVAVNTSANCSWSASTAATWITITSSGSGTGNGSVAFTVAPNSGTTQRAGTITVAGVTYTVTQFGSACAYSISPVTLMAPSSTGTATVTLNSSAGGCGWSASWNSPWLGIIGTTSGPDAQSVSVIVSIASNPSPSSRVGLMYIAGELFTVTQAGSSCSFSLGTAPSQFGPGSGFGFVSVYAPLNCPFTVDPGPSWITAQPPYYSSGRWFVPYYVAANSTTTARAANMKIAGLPYSVTQLGEACSFSLSLITSNPIQPAGGGGGTVLIGAQGSGCAWTASSSAAWLTAAPSSGAGSGMNFAMNFGVAANPNASARSATLTVAGQNIVITQAGQTCGYSLRSTSGSSPSGGGASAVDVLTAPGCPWSATSQAAWIAVTGGASSNGPGGVSFSVAPNATPISRTGTISIAGQTFGVTQAAAPCFVTIGPPASTPAGESGGTGTFNYTTSLSGCALPVQSYTSWIQVTGTTYSGNAGTVSFLVSPNTYSAARSGVIKVGDQSFTVNQAASTCAYNLLSFGASFGPAGGPGTLPIEPVPAQCGPPAVQVNAPVNMLTLGTLLPQPPNYIQNYLVTIYQSFINYVRSGQLTVNGQIYNVKQTSY